MQIDMAHIGPDIRRSAEPNLRVQICAIHIDLAAGLVNYLSWQQKSLSHLPDSVTPMFNMGLQSVIGTDLAGALGDATRRYAREVGEGTFPAAEHTF